jgi:quercetin dioxygenase-like cupin family protein
MHATRLVPRALVMAVAAVAIASAGVALATSGSGLTTTILSVGQFGSLRAESHTRDHNVSIETEGTSDVYVVDNVLAPGGSTGWHTHPGPSLITVKSGTITAYEGDDPTCTPHVYTAGTGFLDPGNGHVHILRNEGAVPAETVAVQFLEHGAVRRIDAPNPGTCGF